MCLYVGCPCFCHGFSLIVVWTMVAGVTSFAKYNIIITTLNVKKWCMMLKREKKCEKYAKCVKVGRSGPKITSNVGPHFVGYPWLLVFNIHFLYTYIVSRVQINILWFGKYNTFFIFHDSFFHLPGKSWYQNKFLFLIPKKKDKPLSCFKVKNDLDVMCILFLLKQ